MERQFNWLGLIARSPVMDLKKAKEFIERHMSGLYILIQGQVE